MPPVGFEPTFSAGERTQTYALDRAASGTGNYISAQLNLCLLLFTAASSSSVGVATELQAGRSGIESRWGRDFPPVQTGPGAHPASYTMGTGSFPGG